MNSIFIERPDKKSFLHECEIIRENYKRYGSIVIRKEFENADKSKSWIISKEKLELLKSIFKKDISREDFSKEICSIWEECITCYVNSIEKLITIFQLQPQAQVIIFSDETYGMLLDNPNRFVVTAELWEKICDKTVTFQNYERVYCFKRTPEEEFIAIKDEEGKIYLLQLIDDFYLYWRTTIEPNNIIEM